MPIKDAVSRNTSTKSDRIDGAAALAPTIVKYVRKDIAEMLMNEVKAGTLTALIARAPDFYGPENEKSFLNEVVYKNLLKGKLKMEVLL